MATKRRLSCCVCGDDAGRWQQHWNRDTGYGVCVKCIEWTRDRAKQYRGGHKPETVEAEIIDLYGKEGVNWGREPAEEHWLPYWIGLAGDVAT